MVSPTLAALHKIQKRKKSHRMIDDLDYVDFISSNVNSSSLGKTYKTNKEANEPAGAEVCGDFGIIVC